MEYLQDILYLPRGQTIIGQLCMAILTPWLVIPWLIIPQLVISLAAVISLASDSMTSDSVGCSDFAGYSDQNNDQNTILYLESLLSYSLLEYFVLNFILYLLKDISLESLLFILYLSTISLRIIYTTEYFISFRLVNLYRFKYLYLTISISFVVSYVYSSYSISYLSSFFLKLKPYNTKILYSRRGII